MLKMKIRLNNLGVINDAEIDLCKKLNLFCGPNSTGKTYVAYVVYGITKLLMVGVQLFKLQELVEKKEIEVTLDYEKLYNLHKTYLEFIKDNIAGEFAAKPDFFTDFNLQLITSLKEFKTDLKSTKLNYDYEFAAISLNMQKESSSDSLKIKLNKPVTLTSTLDKFEVYILAILSKYLIFGTLVDSFMLPVERNSVYTFSKELSLKRLKKSDDKNIEEAAEIQERLTRYPHALRDALAVAEDLANIRNRETKFKYLADEIENDILHGKIQVSDQGELQFFTSNDDEKVIPVHLSASLIKTLSGLIIYLRHQATSNDLIIIDEPELNLHPDNQILLTRILVRLVNNGFRLLISTHSDYIIRELNNLIMLSSKNPEIEALATQYGYQAYHKLDPNIVGAYLFNFNSENYTKVVVENLTILENGFEVKTIDAAINSLNDISEELYYALKSTDNE